MNASYDLLVVGAGILGTAHAYHALQRGLRVAILDKSRLPQGSSVQNFGQVVPSGFGVEWQRYGRRSLEIYQSLQANFDISVRQNGTVYIASNEEELTLLEELAAINSANGYESRLLTARECLLRYPGLRADYCLGGLFFPQEITVEPRVVLHRILQYLTEHKGLHFFHNALAVEVEPNGEGCCVRTSDRRTYHAGQVLVCSGYEFKTLFPEIFAQSDLLAVKLHMLMLESQPTQRIPGSILTGLSIRRYESFSECPSWAGIMAKENPHSPAKRWGVHILFKQAMDGSVILGDSHEYARAAEAESLGLIQKEEIIRYMMAEARMIFDLQTWNLRESWIGTYTQCQDADIFRHSIDGRIHLLTGIGGKGMTASLGFAEENLRRYL